MIEETKSSTQQAEVDNLTSQVSYLEGELYKIQGAKLENAEFLQYKESYDDALKQLGLMS